MRVLLLCTVAAALQAQSISITSPTANQAVSGFTGFSFMVNVTNAPSTARVCYTVDAYPATNPGFGALSTAGCSITPPYSYDYNTYWVMNGSHQVTATAYDALGGVVAANTQPFTVANKWPVTCTDGSAPVFSVTTGTPVSSVWSGTVSVTAQITGSCATDSLNYHFYLDDIQFGSVTTSSGSAQTFSLDTTRFLNGSGHVLAVTVNDNTHNTTYTDGIHTTEDGAGEWTRQIAISNAASPAEVWNVSHDLYITPGATGTLGCVGVNTDQSLVSSPVCDYYSTNSAIFTVNSSGMVTAASSLPQQGTAAAVFTMLEKNNCSDLSTVSGNPQVLTSTCYTFTGMDAGRLLVIKGGPNWIAGTYLIKGTVGTGQIDVCAPTTNYSGCPIVNAATGAGSGGVFSTGPTRIAWVLGQQSNILPHFTDDNRIVTSYDPAHSIFTHCGFASSFITQDQLYSPGIGYDVSNSGFNCFETGAWGGDLTSYSIGQQSNFASAVNSQVSNWAARFAALGFTKPIFTWLIGDQQTGSNTQMWAATNPASPAYGFSPSALTTIFSAWKGIAIAMSGKDEVNSAWGGHPLAGPITFTGGANGSISSITAVNGTCTVNGVSGFGIIGGFIIHGATNAALNTTPPTINHSTSSFACTGLPDGTYNNSTDPGLMLEPFANTWFASNTSYMQYTAFSTFRTLNVAVGAGREFLSWPNAANTNCSSMANWSGNSNQSNSGVSNVSDFNDLYPNHGNEQYISARVLLNSVVNDSVGFGVTMRSNFGCYNPAAPSVMLTQGTSTAFGFQGYPVPIASISNDLITFSAPHGVTNIIPGLSRLWITGSGSSAYNTNFYIIDAPTPTTMHVVLAATDFSDPGTAITNGGTLTFRDGTTLALTGEKATGTISLTPLGSTHVTYSGNTSDGSAPQRHRCQTFTISGVAGGNAAWTTRTFNYVCENFPTATDGNGSASQYMFVRELPSGSSSGGTAYIVPDNTMVKGRNGDSQLLDYNPEFTFGTVIECAILRCAGQRLYQWTDQFQEYQDHYGGNGITAGWGPHAMGAVTTFQDTTNVNQLQANQHFENARSVPVWHAASVAAMAMNRWRKYILEPTLPSPDYDAFIDCGARTSVYGNILMCWNGSDSQQSRTFKLTPYLQSGQSIIRSRITYQGIKPLATLAPDTATETLALEPGEAVFYIFPANFAAELVAPTLAVRLADVSTAAGWAVRFSYDRYLLDAPVANVQNCGAAQVCTLNADANIGTIYYRIVYVDAFNRLLASSDVLTI